MATKNPLLGQTMKLSGIQKDTYAQKVLEIDTALVGSQKQIRGKDNPGFSDESLNELATDMKIRGQKQPVVVRENPDKQGHYIIISGERRWRAAKRAGLKIKAILEQHVVDVDAIEADQFSENSQRVDLTSAEYAELVKRKFDQLGCPKKVAAHFVKSEAWVSQMLSYSKVAAADKSVAGEALRSGTISDVTAINKLRVLEKNNPKAAAQAVAEVRKGADARKIIQRIAKKAKVNKTLDEISGLKNSPLSLFEFAVSFEGGGGYIERRKGKWFGVLGGGTQHERTTKGITAIESLFSELSKNGVNGVLVNF
jgi:ParB family chromosome partitioning protein